ncbi:hypothetical protein Q8F55_003402 [Vanrija albida]|uniref:AMP-dependent synthetase/ligase domain-containing protein n=1 Tax=Vanrija albida TaxID=181172 RepID=A0ABR3Q3V1_9TREE
MVTIKTDKAKNKAAPAPDVASVATQQTSRLPAALPARIAPATVIALESPTRGSVAPCPALGSRVPSFTMEPMQPMQAVPANATVVTHGTSPQVYVGSPSNVQPLLYHNLLKHEYDQNVLADEVTTGCEKAIEGKKRIKKWLATHPACGIYLPDDTADDTPVDYHHAHYHNTLESRVAACLRARGVQPRGALQPTTFDNAASGSG